MTDTTGYLMFQKRIKEEDVMRNRKVLYVFGDNMLGVGKNGQSMYGRGQRNAVGIPTKWKPSRDPEAYFKDSDLEQVKPMIDMAFERLIKHLQAGGIVVWPEDGVGTGLARLRELAPVVYRYIGNWMLKIQDVADHG